MGTGSATIIVGSLWGFTGLRMHSEMIVILCLTMLVATPTSTLLSRMKVDAFYVVYRSIFIGWCVSSVFVLCVMPARDDPSFFGRTAAVWGSILLLVALLLSRGAMLMRCDPDDGFRIVVVNTVLLMVITIPFLLIFVFCSSVNEQRAEEERQAE